MEMYEAIVFENQEIYATVMISKENVVEEFTKLCFDYINPHYIEQKYTRFEYGKTFVAYKDLCADKPKLVLLTGITVTTELVSAIRDIIKKNYANTCESENGFN
jgi:hypothetical protein